MRSALLLAIFAISAAAQSYTISTVAGGGLPVNIPGVSASLYGTQSALAVDAAGNLFFVDGNTILRLDAVTGILSLVAGNGTAGYSGDNGPAVSAQLHSPYGLALDPAGNVYVASFYDNVVRRISGGTITTIVGTGAPGFSGDGGPAASARLNSPYGIAVDSGGNLFIADSGNGRIRKVSGGVITTVAGTGTVGFSGDNGPATGAQLNAPHSLAVDSSGNIFIADSGNNRVREVANGVIGTIAGNGTAGYSGDNGPANSAQLNLPCGVAVDGAGNLLIADYYNNRVRKVSNGVVTTLAGKGTPGFAGDGGSADLAQLNDPFVVAVDSAGSVYVGDYGNNRIRKVSAAGAITTAAGNGTSGLSGDGGSAVSAQMHYPYGVAVTTSGDIYTADFQNDLIRIVSNGVINTVAGSGVAGFGGDAGPARSAQFNQPLCVALDASGGLYVADFGNNRIRKLSGGIVSTVAGNGTAGFAGDSGQATLASLNAPAGIAVDSAGNLYIADSGNNRIRRVSASGVITTVAGSGAAGFAGDAGSATSALLNSPSGVALDAAGNLYIADSGNNRIRKITGGNISTVAGNGTAGFSGDNASATNARLNAPGGVAVSPTGVLLIADTLNNVIRRVAGGVITTIAGGGVSLGDNGPATAAGLASPQSVAVNASGNIYVADTLDNRIRLLTPLPLSIVSPSVLPAGAVGTAYNAVTFTAAGGSGGYTWSATGLPAGMTITAAGILSGNPTAAGHTTPQFTVKDSSLNTASTTLSLDVVAPTPTIASVSPATATAGGATFTLTVNGTGFGVPSGAAILWNSVALTTKVVSSTQLTASIAASLIANPGSITIAVTSGGNTSDPIDFPINPPTPTLKSMAPTSTVATGAAFTLTATGTGFVQASQLEWNGGALQTVFVSATQLTATVPASLIAAAGTASVLANSGGTPSSALTFQINPPPAITGVSPASGTAYGPAFTLTVNGTGFVAGAVVGWNGSPLVTKVVSATQLTAAVPANMILGAGSVAIVVTSGGVVSTAFPFPLNPPPPVITSLLPAAVTATGPAFTLTVNGTGFGQNAVILWNGVSVTTTPVSGTQLTAYIAASLIANPGTINIIVNSAGATSAAASFAVAAPPAISGLNPGSVVVQSAGFTLAVSGTGFGSGAQIQWNGAPLPTTFVSATQLTASVAAGLINSVGNVTILVNYSGVSSNGATFPIVGPPSISSLSPASILAGGAAFTLTVNGAGFVSGASITWNGSALVTKLVSPTQLTAAVTASLIAGAGSVNIIVVAGSASSNPVTFPVNPHPVISSINPGTVPGAGTPFTLTITGTGFVAGAVVQWNGTALTTTFVSATQLTAEVPANLAAGTGTANIVATNPDGVASAAAKLSITAAKPAVTPGGVVPVYSSSTVIQPGSWISIYGTGLANGIYSWKGDFPTSLGGTSVKINNKTAYLWFVSPTQINLQAPDDTTTGTVNVIVTTGAGSVTSTVTLAAYGPSFSLFSGSPYAAAVIPGATGYELSGPAGLFAFTTRPVKAGEILELYGVGFGPTKSAVPAGKVYTGIAAPTTNPVTITIGGVPAQVLFAGLVQSGVYQINIIVPAAGHGDQALLATVNGIQSPANVLIAMQ